MDYEKKYKDAMLVEQNAILQELKALHLRMEHQTVCNDAGGNKMWSRAWRLVNEAINVIKNDKEVFKNGETMNIEEKARAYDKAIEKIKYVMEHGVSPVLNKEDLEDIFHGLKESEDELEWLTNFIEEEEYYQTMDIRDDNDRIRLKKLRESLDWLRKQSEKPEDEAYPKKDEEKPNGGIVLEDFNEGNGFYKVNLAYLSKEQVEEIESLVTKWNPKATDETIRNCIGLCLTDVNEKRFRDYNTSLKDCLAWLEKQREQKEYTFKSLPRLLDMIEPTSKAKAYCQKLIDTLVKEGYVTDAKIVGECLKQMNGEKVALATMDEKQAPKPKWTEEDEKLINLLIAIFEVNYPDKIYKINPIGTIDMEAIRSSELINQLKSLKQRMEGQQ